MKCTFLLLAAVLATNTANAGDLKWSGSLGWIYSKKTEDDSLSSKRNSPSSSAHGKDVSSLITKSHAVRGNLGVNTSWDNIEVGTGIRTSSGVANNDQVTVQSSADRTIALEQAWMRYLHDFGSVKMNVTAGRQKNVFAYDSVSENFFDNDLRLDGFGWQFKFGMFGLNLGQYITGGKSQASNGSASISYTEGTDATVGSKSRFNTLFGFQPTMNFKFTDDIETMLAVGYFHWNDNANTNQTSAGTNLTNNTATSTVAIIPSVAFKIHNPKQWQVYNTWTLPYGFVFSGEFVLANKAHYDNTRVTNYPGAGIPTPEANNKAWSAGLTYGTIAKAHDWNVMYFYNKKGLASVIGAYSGDAFLPDNKGHVVKANFAVSKDFVIGGVAMWMKEDGRVNANGVSATGVAYANANAQQELKTNYYELNAGISF